MYGISIISPKGLPPDVMHDVFEGVAVVELKCMLQYMVQDRKLFTVTYLNERILHFPFGYVDVRSKPNPLPENVFTSTTLKQSGKL